MNYHKDYCLPFNEISLSNKDIDTIKSQMREHDDKRYLDYQPFLANRTILRTEFAKDLKEFANKFDMKLSVIAALTANPGTVVPIHIDGDPSMFNDWRLTFYSEGEPGDISWYNIEKEPVYSSESKAYRFDNLESASEVFTTSLDQKSAIIRTGVPHSLDLRKTTRPRLTITATFHPAKSWAEMANYYYATI